MTVQSSRTDRVTVLGRSPRRRVLDLLRAGLADQRRLARHRSTELELAVRWRDACAGVGLCQWVCVNGDLTVRTPRFGALRDDASALTFSVELLPGSEAGDVAAHASRLAHALGFRGLGVQAIEGRWVRVVLQAH